MGAEEDEQLLGYLAGGGLTAPDTATPRYRAEVTRLMAVLADLMVAGAAGFADCINLAPPA